MNAGHDRAPGTPFSSEDVVRVSGASYRQIDHWCRVGYLHPTDPVPGSGGYRQFSVDEMEVAVRIARLTRAGIMAWAASALVRRCEVQGEWLVGDLDDGVQVLFTRSRLDTGEVG